MIPLTLHQRNVENVFDLLGQSEDGMTYALGWAMSQNPGFHERVSSKLRLGGKIENQSIHLQKSRSGFGRTDIELISHGTGTVVIEAKKGFVIPSNKQLEKYVQGFRKGGHDKASLRHIVVLTAYPDKVAFQLSFAPKSILGVPVKYLAWRTILDLAERSLPNASGSGKRTLKEFIAYLRKVVSMRDKQSNLVYVVSLSRNTFDEGETTFVQVVEEHGKYFHPVGNGYPKEPPNYIAFRYDGKLQSIHFIENVDVITSYKKHFSSVAGNKIEPHFLYTLGPEIRPTRDVRSGPIRNMKCYCMLDTLLTSATVQEALRETKRRLEGDI